MTMINAAAIANQFRDLSLLSKEELQGLGRALMLNIEPKTGRGKSDITIDYVEIPQARVAKLLLQVGAELKARG